VNYGEGIDPVKFNEYVKPLLGTDDWYTDIFLKEFPNSLKEYWHDNYHTNMGTLPTTKPNEVKNPPRILNI
jgi:hypothetical protein